MTLYIFDTDHLSLYQRGHSGLAAKLNPATLSRIAISVITAEEAIRGRFSRIRAARSDAELLQAYDHLRQTLELIKDIKLVDYDAKAHTIYLSLSRQKIRIGTPDLRIASVALSTGFVLVTRNQSDLGQVPGLVIEDWTA